MQACPTDDELRPGRAAPGDGRARGTLRADLQRWLAAREAQAR